MFIWYLIGWCVLGFIAGALTGQYCGWVSERHGCESDEIFTYMLRFHVEREGKHVSENTSWFVVIVMFIFNSVFWPVKILRLIFLDIPDAIEFYESQQNKEEQV